MASTAPDLRSLTFLVVDDSDIMRRIIGRNLAELQCRRVLEAGDGHEAWEVLHQYPVDFILCDWNMPGMKGIDFLVKVRESEHFSTLPFLMISAESKPENILEAVSKGVSNYLTKPFDAAILKKKIEMILHSQQQNAVNSVA